MKPTPKKLITGALALLVLFCGFVSMRLQTGRSFDAPYPELHASSDPAAIERGQYLVYGPAHCVDCHSNPADEPPKQGQLRKLSGGVTWDLPPGKFYAKNITPDLETGIGRYTDPELARLLRHGVKPDGSAALPFMRYSNLADDDLVAILSFLRSQEPVRHEVPESELTLLGKAVLAFVIEPTGPTRPLQKTVPRGPTVEYGDYLASDVAGCANCHTKLDLKTGAFAGKLFAGGAEHPSKKDPNQIFVSPNLTPHPKDGWLDGWSEDAFVRRMSTGPVFDGTPMPWESYALLTEEDSRAIYRFLSTLSPAKGGPDPRVRRPILASVEAR